MPKIFQQVVVGTNFFSDATMSTWYCPDYKHNHYSSETSESTDFCGWQKNCSCLLGIWKIFLVFVFCRLLQQILFLKLKYYKSNIFNLK